MKRIAFTVCSLMLLVSVVLLAGSCSGGGGVGSAAPAPKVQLSGTVAGGYTTASAKPQSFFARLFTFVEKAYAQAGVLVNKVVAIPIQGGTTSGGMMSLSQSATPDPTGKFSLSLDKSYDWMLVLLDTTATTTAGRFVGYVDLSPNLATSNSLLLLPANGASITSHDLGNIINTGSTGSVTNSISALSFSLTTTQLTTMAKSDDMLRFAKNMVMNYDPATGIYYNLRPNYIFDGDYNAAKGSFAFKSAATYTMNGYTLQLDSNVPKTTLSMDMVTGLTSTNLPTAQTAVELFPSQTVSSGSYTFGPAQPFTNIASGITCTYKDENGQSIRYCPGNYLSITDYSDISYWYGMNSSISGTVPPGQWIYKVGGATKAEFDIAAADPINGNKIVLTPIPVLKANVSVADVLQSIDVQWYIANSAGTGYDLLTDTSILSKISSNCDYAIEGNSTSGAIFAREQGLFNPATQTQITPADTWYFDSVNVSQQFIMSLQVHCDSGGVGFFYQYTKP